MSRNTTYYQNLAINTLKLQTTLTVTNIPQHSTLCSYEQNGAKYERNVTRNKLENRQELTVTYRIRHSQSIMSAYAALAEDGIR